MVETSSEPEKTEETEPKVELKRFRDLKGFWYALFIVLTLAGILLSINQIYNLKFFVDFEFKNFVLQKAIGLVFNEAMTRIVRAFEERARVLYG